MKLSEISKHPELVQDIDRTYIHKFETDENGKKIFKGLDMENPKVYDLGTADPRDEMGFARYCEQYRGAENTDTSGFVNEDVLNVAQRAKDIYEAAEAVKA